jgi:CDP-2,3-bis-(O-geranylgeranyl)-sn-glycerol synthase
MLELQLLIVLMVANGAPILARRLLGDYGNLAIDHGYRLADGQPLFGANKTWRGLAASLLATLLAVALFMLPLWFGLLIASFAMLGDLLSSFIKRRLAKPESSQVLGLDQLPESFLPLLVGSFALDYGLPTVLLVSLLFLLLERWLSPLLFSLGIRLRNH